MQLIGIYLGTCDKSIGKNLKENWYPFGNFDNCHEIFDKDGKCNKQEYDKIQKQINKNQTFINELYKLKNAKSPRVNFNCILGMNGAGKSSLLNLEYRIINNFSCKINHCLKDFNQGHSLVWATGFNAELYYCINREIYCIRIKDNLEFEFIENDDEKNIHNPIERVELIYKNYEELSILFSILEDKDSNKITKEDYISKEKKLIALLSKHFFYSISTNYSIYSNATVRDFMSEEEEQWQKRIYHKNDAYLTPIVLVPYKGYGATIDTEKELSLAKERVSTIALLIYLESGKDFIENLFPIEVQYVLKSSKSYAEEIKKKYIKLINPDRLGTDTIDNLYDELDEINNISKLHETVKEIWQEKLSKVGHKNNLSYNDSVILKGELENTIVQNSLEYLAYKTIKMCKQYDIYRNNFPEKNIINDYNNYQKKCLESIKTIIDKILKYEYKIDFSNLKVYQCLCFFENIDFYLSGKTYSELLDYDKNIVTIHDFENLFKVSKKIELNYDNVFINLFPPYFAKETFFSKKIEDDNIKIPVSALSSGESQLLNSLSYAVYHMKNASSKQEDNERIEYKNINLIFDEAELYYHPEYQRKFIADLLRLIDHSNLENIDSINITIVTHSPFMLSDIPNSNILALEDGRKRKLDFETLGANIYDLLKKSFFMTSTIGNQTENNISNFILYYNEWKEKYRKNKNFKNDKVKEEFYKKLINSIGDEYLHMKLNDMLLQIKNKSFNNQLIQEYENKIKNYKKKISEIKGNANK